jgi:hypothetical protein
MIEEILEPECPKGRASGDFINAKPSRTDEAQRSQNLAHAWQRLKANKGAPGIDGMTVSDFCLRSPPAMRSVVSSSGNHC